MVGSEPAPCALKPGTPGSVDPSRPWLDGSVEPLGHFHNATHALQTHTVHLGVDARKSSSDQLREAALITQKF